MRPNFAFADTAACNSQLCTKTTGKTCPDSWDLKGLVNDLRAKHSAPGLTYSEQLAAAAGAHAATLTCRSLAAASNVPYGQNLYGLSGPAYKVDDTCSTAITNWWVNRGLGARAAAC